MDMEDAKIREQLAKEYPLPKVVAAFMSLGG